MKLGKKKKYLITGGISLLILMITFIVKGIFPFGDHSIIWSDMHDQITALYCHFYDAILGKGSLFVDFTSGGGINFFGIMAYYILSPFSFLLLLFPRELVENAVSIVVALKIVLASLTSLYFIDKYFEKIKPSYQILLSLLYAFSSYTFLLYIITPWMDLVYLFPLLLIGLQKLLDLEGDKVYIIVLTLCLIFSFYVTFMVLLFIILASILYLHYYRKEQRKEAIFHLGIATVLSLLMSSFVLIPTFLQISSSQRVGWDFSVIANSKFGPLSDKIAFLFASGTLVASLFFLLLAWIKKKNFARVLVPIMILMGIPLIVEPINKMWHFGSYVCFPYRYGFILIFLLVISACCFLNHQEEMFQKEHKKIRFLSYILPVLTVLVTIFATLQYKEEILEAIDSLTFTRDKTILLLLFAVFALNVFSIFLLFFTRPKNGKFTISMVFLLSIFNIFFHSYFFIGKPEEENLSLQYDWMLDMSRYREEDNPYYLKEVNRDLISNYGMVTGIRSYSNFTSLTDKTNFLTMQKLGYDSYWMDTESIGGNLFTDIVLAQKYIVSLNKLHDAYYHELGEKDSLFYYEWNYDMPFGYVLLDNPSLENVSNSFDATNKIYESITGKQSLIDTISIFETEEEKHEISKNEEFSQKISVEGRKRIYLEIFSDFQSSTKTNNYDAFDIYVNGNLLYQEFPNDEKNGTILLGDFEEEEVEVQIIAVDDAKLRNMTIGVLDLEKMDQFLETYEKKNVSSSPVVTFEKNKIIIDVTGKEGDLLFLPITYLDGYTSDYDLVRVYDNFLGIKLHTGRNQIEVSYLPKGWKLGVLISIVGVVLSVLWIRKISKKSFPFASVIVYDVYLVVYFLLILVLYVVGIFLFIKSFLFP